MPYDGCSESPSTRPSPSDVNLNGVPTPATPGVWAVSHRDIDRAQQERAYNSGSSEPSSSFELVTDVTFIWPYPAGSAFVTGNFSNWETTVAMVQTSSPDGPIWIYSKALPPGDYQYKFIIDNVWRHAPDQPITFDERGIINNFLTVTVEACGDVTCFCSNFFSNSTEPTSDANNGLPSTSQQLNAGLMTPKTVQRIRRNIGVAYKYVERETNPQNLPFRKAYMHIEVPDKPFDVTVVNVTNWPSSENAFIDSETTDGTISRASSFECIPDATIGGTTESSSSSFLDHFSSPRPPQKGNAQQQQQQPQYYEKQNKNCNFHQNQYTCNSKTEKYQNQQKYYRMNNTNKSANNQSSKYSKQQQRQQYSKYSNLNNFQHLDPSVPFMDDAAYAAKLNDQAGTIPHTAPYRASALSSDPTQLAYSVRARLSSPVLGFNPNECHEGIRLTDTNHCAVRVQERGLYKTVRSVLPLKEGRQNIYFEFFIFRQSTGGSVCVGLSTQELPLNCLCGTRPNSIGYSTSGNLIRTVDGEESWSDFGDELQSGCTVGCLVSVKTLKSSPEQKDNNNDHMDGDSTSNMDKNGGGGSPNNDSNNGNNHNIKKRTKTKRVRSISIDFYADGKYKDRATYDFVGDLEIFPTLSLFAKHARVYSLFNGHDMLFSSCLPEEEIITLDGQTVERNNGSGPILGLDHQTRVSKSEALPPQR